VNDSSLLLETLEMREGFVILLEALEMREGFVVIA
jgi:hypothetical protein